MKKTWLMLFLFALTLAGCNSLFRKSKIESQNDSYLQELYSETLSRMYKYMFAQNAPYQNINRQNYGSFQAGFKGLVLYTNFTETIRSMEEIKVEGYASFYDLSPLRVLSGLNVFTDNSEEFDELENLNPTEPFHHYNPKFISWAANYLIPSPEMEIHGLKPKEIYHSTFGRFFEFWPSLINTYT